MQDRFQISENFENDSKDVEINLFEMSLSLIKRKKLIFFSMCAITLLAVFILIMIPNSYESTASILPSGDSDQFSSLRTLAGFPDISQIDENSSKLFPVILESRLIQDAVLNKEYNFNFDGEDYSIKLDEHFGIDDPDHLREYLSNITDIETLSKTGVIEIGVETLYPELSQQILTNYLKELEDFNLNKRRSRAKDNERYLARELKDLEIELKDAEDKLEEFQLLNRDWHITNDPIVIKELSRLKRMVQFRTEAYLLLNKEYELTKLKAQKDVPIVRILNPPSLPTLKSGPFRAKLLVLIFITSFFALIFAILIFDGIQKVMTKQNKQAFEKFLNSMSLAFPNVNRLIRKKNENKIDIEV